MIQLVRPGQQDKQAKPLEPQFVGPALWCAMSMGGCLNWQKMSGPPCLGWGGGGRVVASLVCKENVTSIA